MTDDAGASGGGSARDGSSGDGPAEGGSVEEATSGDSRPAWLTIARYEATGRTRGTLTLTGLLSAFVIVFLAFFPSFKASGIDLDAYVDAFPPAFREAFGIITISTVEGFLAVEFYQFAWVILLGLYLAYVGGETVAEEIESRRLDLTLAAPVRRHEVIVGKFLGLVPLVLVLNAVLPVMAYVGVLLIGETIAVERLVVTHLLAVPYHLACAAIGVTASTLLGRAGLAQRVALGVVFALFMFESLTALTDHDWLGYVSPTAHYDPSEILVNATYDWTGGLVLLVGAAALIGVAIRQFRRADLTG